MQLSFPVTTSERPQRFADGAFGNRGFLRRFGHPRRNPCTPKVSGRRAMGKPIDGVWMNFELGQFDIDSPWLVAGARRARSACSTCETECAQKLRVHAANALYRSR